MGQPMKTEAVDRLFLDAGGQLKPPAMSYAEVVSSRPRPANGGCNSPARHSTASSALPIPGSPIGLECAALPARDQVNRRKSSCGLSPLGQVQLRNKGGACGRQPAHGIQSCGYRTA
jgi:hypothetical protein